MRMKGGHRDKNQKNKTEFQETIEICSKLSWSQQNGRYVTTSRKYNKKYRYILDTYPVLPTF